MGALLCFGQSYATINPDSIAANIFEIERNSALHRISFEKVRIANDYKSADIRLLNLIDSVTAYILQLKKTMPEQNNYLNRLQAYLKNINRYYSDSYLKNGTYLAVLSYFPMMIEWEQEGTLAANLQRYESFSIKATRLMPNDSTAESFLYAYMKDYPDDIFRYADEYDDRPFARKLLEAALKTAPESAKRYFTTANSVSSFLHESKDPYTLTALEIYRQYGIKSRAYILLDDIVSRKLGITAADSIGNNPDAMFAYLVQKSTDTAKNSNYSAYRYLSSLAIDQMRKLNFEMVSSDFTSANFKRYSPEELFTLLVYGYKETTRRAFQTFAGALKKQVGNSFINSAFIASLDRQSLKELVMHCDRDQTLDSLLILVDNKQKNYLLALTTMDDKEEETPPFKQFFANGTSGSSGSGYRSIAEVVKEHPSKSVNSDAPTEAIPQIRKPVMSGTVVPAAAAAPQVPESKQSSEAQALAPMREATPPEVAEAVPAPIVPSVPEVAIAPIKIELGAQEKEKLALKKNILKSLQDIPSFIEQPYAEEILDYAATREPDELLKKVDQFKQKHYCTRLLEECAVSAPVSIKRYLYNPSHPVNLILQHSDNPVVKKILEINPQLGYQSKTLLLLDDLMNNRLTLAQALRLSENPVALFSALTKIIARPSYIGKYSINREMRDFSLRFVREINDKIAMNNASPFNSVEAFNAQELYFLMLYGRDEVFTSTFNGLFHRFMSKMPNGGGEAFFRSVNRNQFRDFLSLCANYNVLHEFLEKFTPAEKTKLLADYITNLEKEQDNLSSVVLVAEAISNLNDGQILALLEGSIKREYERVSEDSDQIGISIYGVLSSIISGNAKTDADWYHKISRQFSIAPVSLLTQSALFNQEGVCVQQMYFYNDDDGRSSFVNFMNTYKDKVDWKIEDKYNYVRISSQSGKRVEILANKPEYEENGVNAIGSYLRAQGLTPTVIVHRGHSFHTEATLEKVPSSAKLVFVGSCGGFYKISIALENAPDAHIISTKQIGTKTVNDAVLYALNENIRQGKDIVWNEFWDRMKDKLANNRYFSDYIPPQKNLESTFIRAYYKTLGV